LERAAIPEHLRKPVFVYIDEAYPLIDEKIETILTQARKYNVGLIVAHQSVSQLRKPSYRHSLESNTSIKMASGVSHVDATALARDMRTDAEYIGSMKKGQFATYIKGTTQKAVKFQVRFDMLDRLPAMSPAEYTVVKQVMRDRYSAPKVIPAPPTPEPPTVEPLSTPDVDETAPQHRK
jgi:DNA helicase HerA-like ATPase